MKTKEQKTNTNVKSVLHSPRGWGNIKQNLSNQHCNILNGVDKWNLTQDAGEKQYLLNIVKHLQF